MLTKSVLLLFFYETEDGIGDLTVTGVQTCALPIYCSPFRVLRMTPSRPKAQPSWELGNRRSKRFWLSPLTKDTSIGLFCLIQPLPPFLLWKMTPNSPAIQPLSGLTKETLLRIVSSPMERLAHVRPPSLLERTVPRLPTAHPNLSFTKSMPKRCSSVPLF